MQDYIQEKRNNLYYLGSKVTARKMISGRMIECLYYILAIIICILYRKPWTITFSIILGIETFWMIKGLVEIQNGVEKLTKNTGFTKDTLYDSVIYAVCLDLDVTSQEKSAS